MEFHELPDNERERLTNIAVRRCTCKLGHDVNPDDVRDMKQDARLKMWQVCRDQNRKAEDYNDAGYLIACGTNAAWGHWTRFVLGCQSPRNINKRGTTDAKEGGLASRTFPLDYYTDQEECSTWEEIIPAWADLTPITINDEPPPQVLSDERWDMLYHLLPQFYPRISDRGRRSLLQTLELLIDGCNMSQIAEHCRISVQAVAKHRKRLMAFLAWLAGVELDEENPYTTYGYTTRLPAPDLTAIPA